MPGAEARLRQRIRHAILIAHPRVLVWGMPASAFSGPGRSDLMGVAYARPFNLEVKTATGKVTKIQDIVLRECRRAGSYAWVVRTPESAVAAIEWIRKRGKLPMPDDILDIEDWFKEVDEAPAEVEPSLTEETIPDPLPPVTANANLDEVDLQELATADQNAFDLANGTATLDAPMTTLEDGVMAVLTKMVELLQQMHKDLRTVGDRVTITWQSANRLENNLLFTNQRIDKLMAMIMEEEAPDVTTSFQLPGEAETEMEQSEPAPRTRRRRAAKA